MTQNRKDKVETAIAELMQNDNGSGALNDLDQLSRRRAIDKALNIAAKTSPLIESIKKPRINTKYAPVGVVAIAASAVLVWISATQLGIESFGRDTGQSIASPITDGRPNMEIAQVSSNNTDVTDLDKSIIIGREVKISEAIKHVKLGGGVHLSLTAGSAFRIERPTADSVVVVLHRGASWISVDPLQKKWNLSIKTPAGTIQVKGTIFAVNVQPSNVSVQVLRGRVQILEQNGMNRSLQAGLELKLGSTSVQKISTSYQIAAWQTVTAAGLVEPSEIPLAFAPWTKETNRDSNTTKREDQIRKATHADHSKQEVLSIKTLLAQIRALRVANDWQGVADTYARLIRHHFGTPDARIAMVTLGTVRLEKLNDPAGAMGWFENYLATGSEVLGPEALFGKAIALGQLGDQSAEQKALTKFVVAHPDNPQVPAARKRISEISKKQNH